MVASEDKSDLDKFSSVMSDEKTVHQYRKGILRSRSKNKRNLIVGGKTFVSRAAKKRGVPSLEMVNDKKHTE